MTVYDCCMFFNENDIYEIKLNQHWNFVDKFIVVEAGETHTGLKKTFNFDKKRFEKYSDKLVYKTFDSFNAEIPKNLDLLDSYTVHQRQRAGQVTDDWIRDNFQANYLVKILKHEGAKDNDIVLMGCLDEIINESAFYRGLERFKDKDATYDVLCADYPMPPWVVQSKKQSRPVFGFMLDFYVYKFNLYHATKPASMMTEFSTLKTSLPATLRGMGIHTHQHIENGGWHFTFADNTDGEKILSKQRSWAHSKDVASGQKIKFDHTTTQEALERLFYDYPFKKVEITEETHPKYLIDNLEKYKDYLYKKNT